MVLKLEIPYLDLVPETQFNVELVVQCLRLSSNPQTHHHAYLLLSFAATIFPVSYMCMVKGQHTEEPVP